MRRLVLALVAAIALAACGDDEHVGGDDAARPDAAVDAPPPDAPPALAPCLDRPGDLPRSPSGQLPCDLLPPGFGT